MALHPAIQARAQDEIDAVTGGNRLPAFDDLTSFPYTAAIVKEILRWAPVAPLGKINSLEPLRLSTGFMIVYRSSPLCHPGRRI
jgi:cytochrome P450